MGGRKHDVERGPDRKEQHRQGSFKSRNLFLMVPETGRLKLKVLADLVPTEESLLDLQTSAFSPCPHTVEREVSASPLISILIEALIPS